MKLPRKMFALTAVWAMVLCTGCATMGVTGKTMTPAQSLAQVEQAYTFGLAAVNVGLSSGLLTQAEVNQALPYLDAVEAALNAAELDVTNGKSTAQTSIDAANAALVQLRPIISKLLKRPITPATKTTTPTLLTLKGDAAHGNSRYITFGTHYRPND